MFSVPSAKGSLTGADDRQLTLRLVGARRYLTRFTDRPLRQAFVVANVDFARRFRGYFAGSKPNAALTYTPHGSQIPVSIVLTIGQPHWNARTLTWTVPATRIRKQADNLPDTTVHINPPVIPNPRSFTDATLLIDDTGPPVWRGCVLQAYTQCPGADLTLGAGASQQDLQNLILDHANFSGADLTNDDFKNTGLSFANLTGTQLTGVTFIDSILRGAQLTNATLTDANLSGAHLTNANLTGADLHNASFGGKCPGGDPALRGADFTGANLTNADLTGACLAFANFSAANLTDANLTANFLPTVRLSADTIFCHTTIGDSMDNRDC